MSSSEEPKEKTPSNESQSPQYSDKQTATAAKLALQSAADNPNSTTAKHLTRFGQSVSTSKPEKTAKKEPKSDESRTPPDQRDQSPKPTPEGEVFGSLWNLTSRIFSRRSDKNKSEKSESTARKKRKRSPTAKRQSADLTSDSGGESADSQQISKAKDPNKAESKMSANEPKPASPELSKGVERDDGGDHRLNSLDWNHLAVQVRKLEFRYPGTKKANPLLKEVTMSIPKSSIYGLLGPSGCGKTTLLRVILGRLPADHGSVSVNGKKPGSAGASVPGPGVGYMPQDLALYSEFSVIESISYFGKIYGMSRNQIKRRIKFLVDFLDLPEPYRKIDHLSGGQKRRVSLAVALVHSPPLLILDEPTVGVDPLLRERIWEHLTILAERERITILITTHYIEEAKRADIVALMRQGRVLIEHSPAFLMRHFGAASLEEVFLKVCRHGESGATYQMPKNFYSSLRSLPKQLKRQLDMNRSEPAINVSSQSVTDFVNSSNSRSNLTADPSKAHSGPLRSTVSTKMTALIVKNFTRIRRNIPLLLFQLALPTIQVILFCICIGKPPYDLNVAVANQEWTANSTDLRLGAIFLDQIDTKTITLYEYDSLDSAMDSVRSGHCWGALVIKPNFTAALLTRAMAQSYMVSDDVLDNSTVDYFGDFSSVEISQTLLQTLLNASQKFELFLIKQLNESKLNPRAIEPLVSFNQPPVYGSKDGSYRDFMAPGVMISITFILAVGLTAVAFIVERNEGLIERTLVAGVRVYQLLVTSVLVHLVILVMQTTLLLIFAFLVFGITNNGPIYLVVALILLQGFAGVSFGLFISTVCEREESAIMLSLGAFYPLIILSGVMWPLEAMPATLRHFSYFLPLTLAIVSLRDIMLRGWGVERLGVWLGFGSTAIWICVFLLAAFIVAHFVKR